MAFGTSDEILQQKECVVKEGDDVGPLGLFVTRDIKYEELIIDDGSPTTVYDILFDEITYCGSDI